MSGSFDLLPSIAIACVFILLTFVLLFSVCNVISYNTSDPSMNRVALAMTFPFRFLMRNATSHSLLIALRPLRVITRSVCVWI